MDIQKKINCKTDQLKVIGRKKLEEIGTQTSDLLPYEYLLVGILDQKNQMNVQKYVQQNAEFRLSPTAMLDRYVEACTRASNVSGDKMS